MRSMTGYGSSEGRVGKGILFAEVRSVNSRFLDINCKIPPSMFPIESKIKKLIQNNVIRGKVDVFLKERIGFAETLGLEVNAPLVRQYKRCLGEINNMLGVKASSHLLEVVDLKDLVVYRDRPLDISLFWGEIESVISAAIRKFNRMRVTEGNTLKADQAKRLKAMAGYVSAIEKRMRVKIAECKKEARAHLNDLPACNAANERNGLSGLSDKLDVTEELTRLKSHISQYKSIMAKKGSVGRQIDFLIQEMHREINTLGSKASDGTTSGLVVEAKSELEKLREQVQNVE